MDRNGKILEGLEKGRAAILEIGPSFYPIAARRDGWNVTIVDHCDQAGLVAKYGAYPQLDVSKIEHVDVVWNGGSLARACGPEHAGQFDAIIASHVIEHIVDPIAFFRDAEALLQPHGRIILAVPDKRLCFDCFRPVSTTGGVMQAHGEGRTRHSPAAVFDSLAHDARPVDGAPSWSRSDAFQPEFFYELVGALSSHQQARQPDHDYIDIHGWVFTPASFKLIILELEALAMVNWSVCDMVERDQLEFLAFLERSRVRPTGILLKDERRRLMIRQIEEAREQAEWLLGGQAAPSATLPMEILSGELLAAEAPQAIPLAAPDLVARTRDQVQKIQAMLG